MATPYLIFLGLRLLILVPNLYYIHPLTCDLLSLSLGGRRITTTGRYSKLRTFSLAEVTFVTQKCSCTGSAVDHIALEGVGLQSIYVVSQGQFVWN